jgi:hypothetical protein
MNRKQNVQPTEMCVDPIQAEALQVLKEAQSNFNNVIKNIARAGGLEADGVLRSINDTKQKLYVVQEILSLGRVK